MRVFLDANVVFSAAKTDGAVRRLVHLLLDGGHECWISGYVESEARRNLVSKGPEAITELEFLLTRLQVSAMQPVTTAQEETGWLPEKDRPVLQAAIALGCDVLVTGDLAHFRKGFRKVFGGVAIHSPRSLAEAVFGQTR
jgi:predicted nucleic acid-binding protein